MKILAIKLSIATLMGWACLGAYAQADSIDENSVWNKKFLWGATFNNALVSFKGDGLPQDYFWRPGLGVTLKTEYYLTKHIGITVGATFQAKGAGIITPDLVKELGNADSTHRARIKFYNLEVPVALIFRGLETFRGTRLHAELGVVPSRNLYSKYIFLSIEDGFHVVENHSDRYYKTDLFIHASLGMDINAAKACIFQVHFYGNWGTKNVYKTEAFPGADGRNNLYGLKLGWLF